MTLRYGDMAAPVELVSVARDTSSERAHDFVSSRPPGVTSCVRAVEVAKGDTRRVEVCATLKPFVSGQQTQHATRPMRSRNI